MAPTPTALARRIEGRLLADEGRLCLVIAADPDTGIAQVSCCVDGERKLIEMPILEVSQRLASHVDLESLNPGKNKRIVEKAEGWFFIAREGMQGPYPTDTAANEALSAHIVALQTTTSAFR